MIFNVKLKININKIKAFKIKKLNQITIKELYELLFNDYIDFRQDYIKSFLGYNQDDGYYWVTIKDNQIASLQSPILSGDHFSLLCINIDILTKYIYYFENLYISDKLKHVNQDTYNLITLLIDIVEKIPSKTKENIKISISNIKESLNKIKIVPKKEKKKSTKLTIRTFLKDTKKVLAKSNKILPVSNIISKKEPRKLKINKTFKKIKNKKILPKKITAIISREKKPVLKINKNFINRIPSKKIIIKPKTSEKTVTKKTEDNKKTIKPLKDLGKDFQNVVPIEKKEVVKINNEQFPTSSSSPLEIKTNLNKNQGEKDETNKVKEAQMKSIEPSSISSSLLDLPVDKKPQILIIEELEPEGNKLFILQTEKKPIDSLDNSENESIKDNLEPRNNKEGIINLNDNIERKENPELNQLLPEKQKEPLLKDEKKEGTLTYLVNGYDKVIWNKEIPITDEYTSVIDIINNSGLPVSIGTNLIDGVPTTYVTGIAGIYNEGDYAWMLKVDGEVPMMSASAIKLMGKKSIMWEYVNWKNFAVNEEHFQEEDKLLNSDNDIIPKTSQEIKKPQQKEKILKKQLKNIENEAA